MATPSSIVCAALVLLLQASGCNAFVNLWAHHTFGASTSLFVRHSGCPVSGFGGIQRGCVSERAGLLGLKGSDLVVLDFEGVICDTFNEVSRAAYRAALEKWPDTMQKAPCVKPEEAGVRSSWVGGDWEVYEQDSGEEVPRWLAEKLRQVRPVTKGNAEIVLASRLCVSEALAARQSDTGRRPLSAGEIISNWEDMKDILYLKCQAEEEELEKMFEAQRKMWRDVDEQGWMDAVIIYPGVAKAMQGYEDKVYVLSTELDPATICTVLAGKGVRVGADRIIDCRPGVGVTKSAALTALLKTALGPFDRLHYVEDQTSMLQKMAGDLNLASAVPTQDRPFHQIVPSGEDEDSAPYLRGGHLFESNRKRKVQTGMRARV